MPTGTDSSQRRNAPTSPVSIAFLVRSLEIGGAETQLAALAKGLDRSRFKATVFCFYATGALVRELRDAGIEVVALEKRGRWDVAHFLRRFYLQMRAVRPDVIHSFMGPPNLIATLMQPFGGRPRVVWGVRSSQMKLSDYDVTWRLTFALERRLSHLPDAIIANSFAGRDHLIAKGFCATRLSVVPNGIDVGRYEADAEAGQALRAEWGVGEQDRLIGLVARLDTKKDHVGFLRAASILSGQRSDVRFVLIGGDGRVNRDELKAFAASVEALESKVIWAGPRHDMTAVYSALDVNCSASAYGEGFPNVVAEAMASEVPCVVTDVGDAKRIVGDTGIVTPPGEPEALAEGLQRILDLDKAQRRTLGRDCRSRISEHFSERVMLERMAAIYDDSQDFRGLQAT